MSQTLIEAGDASQQRYRNGVPVMFVQPAPLKDATGNPIARVVRMPERGNRAMKADGEWVQQTLYWERRLQQGDIVKAAAPAKPEAASATSTATTPASALVTAAPATASESSEAPVAPAFPPQPSVFPELHGTAAQPKS